MSQTRFKCQVSNVISQDNPLHVSVTSQLLIYLLISSACTPESTASLLVKANKGHWVTAREDVVKAKGKGYMKTFFAEPCSLQSLQSTTSGSDPASNADSLKIQDHIPDDKSQRLVDWNVDLLARLMRQIVAHRNSSKKMKRKSSAASAAADPWAFAFDADGTILEEVKEVIDLPRSSRMTVWKQKNEEQPLDPQVLEQLREYVSMIANMYHNDNPFHNFEHVSNLVFGSG